MKVFSESVASLFRQCITILQSERYAEMILAELHVKRSVILMDRLGPDIFATLRMKGHVLHREHS